MNLAAGSTPLSCRWIDRILNPFKSILHSIVPSEKLERILGEIVSDEGLTQLRIAETEKYAHVTFFFNGGEAGVRR